MARAVWEDVGAVGGGVGGTEEAVEEEGGAATMEDSKARRTRRDVLRGAIKP